MPASWPSCYAAINSNRSAYIINYADDLVICCPARAEEALVRMQSMMSRQQQRQRGKDHHAVVRALAFKWILIVFRCWQDRVVYDETRYLRTLAARGSHLTSAFAATAASM